MKYLALLTVSGLLCVSCATTDDPRQGGLAGGIHGLSTGAYDKRVQEREARLQHLKEVQHELDLEQQTLEADRSDRQGRLDELRARLYRLDRESEQLLEELQNKRSQLAEEKEQQAGLVEDLAQLRLEIADLERKQESGLSVAALEAERDRLEEEYRLLLNFYLELGK